MRTDALAISGTMAVKAFGAWTPVGKTAPRTFTSWRAGISRIQQTTYVSLHGEPVFGAPVVGLKAAQFMIPYLIAMATDPLRECLQGLPGIRPDRIAVLLGVEDQHHSLTAKPENLVDLIKGLESALGLKFSHRSCVVAQGDVSVISALALADKALESGEVECAIIGGVETNLVLEKLRSLERHGRLKTGRNSDGMIPGEAAAFIAVSRPPAQSQSKPCPLTVVRGIELENEDLSVCDKPNQGWAWTRAVQSALSRARVRSKDISFRLTNLTGERRLALESSLAAMRIYLDPMPLPPEWCPTPSVGSVGAAVGPLLLTLAAIGFARGHAGGHAATCELFSGGGKRGAVVLTAQHYSPSA